MTIRLSSSLVLLALATPAFAAPAMAPVGTVVESVTVSSPKSLYFGIFGGSGSASSADTTQYGTAFFLEAEGGPLAVNGFGSLDSHNSPFWGLQVGYNTTEILLNPFWLWTLTPAVELEAYRLTRKSFDGEFINTTDRLNEHDFIVSFPMRKTVYLANAVFNFNYGDFPLQPYVGFGIGGAVINVSGASSTQIEPPEPGINHFNASTSDNTSTFAGQIKLGLNYDLNTYISFIAEYRWLYLAGTPFVLGSTVFPGHRATSPWDVKTESLKHNLGNVGIRINL